MSQNNDHRIGKAVVWSSAAEIAAKLISPIVNMILARLLVPEAFAAVATINMIISFAEIFADAGFQKFIVQHEFESEEALDKSTNVAFWTNLFVSTVLCGVICIFRYPLAAFAGNAELGDSVSIASLIIIVVAFSSVQMARYKRAFDFKTLFFVRLGSALIPLVITVPLAVIMKNYWALLIGTFAGKLFTAIVLTIRSKWKPSAYYSFRMLKEMFSFSAWTIFETISFWLTINIGIFVVGNYLSDYYLGLYKTTTTTVNACLNVVTSSVMPVLFSALCSYQSDEAHYKESFYTFQRLTAVLILPIGLGIFLFSDLVTWILLGERWMEASAFVGLWGMTGAVSMLFSSFAGEVFRSKGNPRLSTLSQLLHIAFLIPTLLICVNKGFQTLYTWRSLIRLQTVVTSCILLQTCYGFKFKDICKNLFPPFVATGIMTAVGFGLKMLNGSIVWQVICVFVCVIVYFAALFLLFPNVKNELLSSTFANKIFRRLKKRKT